VRENKECLECGGIYFRGEDASQVHWDARKYCSVGCGSKANMRLMRAGREKAKAGELVLEAPEEEAALANPEAGRQPIRRELRIVRVGPNPRMVSCEYFELAGRRTCTVLVKRNDKYVRGMRLSMAEPVDEDEFSRPWVYRGPAPRRRGRW
jgi:hypothetical protein